MNEECFEQPTDEEGTGGKLQFHPAANLFPLMDGDAFADLVRDIGAHGLNQSAWLLDGKILDGRNRYRACLEAGVEPRFREWIDDGRGPIAFVVSENLHRRHLSDSQRALVAARLATLPRGANQHAQICAPSQTAAAGLLNVSRRSVQEAKIVLERGCPELNAAVGGDRLAVSVAAQLTALPPQRQAAVIEALATDAHAATNEAREIRRRERLGAIANATAPTLESVRGQFPVLYADPPWQHDMCSGDSRSIELNHYPTVATADICALPVSDLAHRDAVLFLWAISPMLPEALAVVQAWGFRYRSSIVWDKEIIGLGFWARNQHELLLIATRGEIPPPAPADRPASVIQARRGEHSVKPIVVYEIIERMYSGLAKLELFARSRRPGWEAWGNEI